MRYIVTGGAGFIGSHIVDGLIEKNGNRVSVIDNLSSGKKENINPSAKFYKADITDKNISEIFKKEKPEVVFHFAAHIEARESVKNPVEDAKINILGSLNIIENCRKLGVKKIMFASSGGEIYGDSKIIPTPETKIEDPISPYGAAKFSVEKYLNSYFKIYGINFVALRYGNVYGPRQNPFGEAGVVAIFTNKMLNNANLVIHGDGRQTKDYIFIEDAALATLAAFEANFNGAINIATGRETSVIEIFGILKKITDYKGDVSHGPLSSIGFRRGCLSVKRAKKLLNWSPQYEINEGLEKTVNWFRSNQRGMRPTTLTKNDER